MTELDKKISAYEKGIKILARLKKEEARIEKLEKDLNKPKVNIKQAQAKINALKKKVRACNKELRALGLQGNIKLVGDLTKRLNQLKRQQAKANMQAKMKMYGTKLDKLKKNIDKKRKEYAKKHKGEILKKAKDIVEKKKSKAKDNASKDSKPKNESSAKKSTKKSDKVNLKALLMALAMVGATGGAVGQMIKSPKAPIDDNAIVEEIEENQSRLQEKHYVVNQQAVYKAHNVDNEYGFVNFRSQPTIGSDVITQLNVGQAVFIKDTPVADTENENATNNWKAAMYYDDNAGTYVDGYVDANLLSGVPENEAAVIIKDEDVQEVANDDEALASDEYFEVNRFEVNTPVLNFRAEPVIQDDNVISTLEEGNTILMYGDDNKSEADTQESSEAQSADINHNWKKAMYHNTNQGIYVGGYLDAQYVAETDPVQENKPSEDKPAEEVSETEPVVDPVETQNNDAQGDVSVSEGDENQTATPKTSGGSVSVDSYNGADIDAFDSYPGYREYLEKLKAEHPNWSFVPYEVNFDFNACVDAECDARAVAIQDGIWSAPWYAQDWVLVDGSSWILPSKAAVACMMDTRNFLNEDQIFQFESMAFSEGQTVEIVKSMLKDVPWANADKFTYTTTSGETVTMDKSFAEIIYDAAKAHGVSATYLASKIMLEQGTATTASYTACGTVPGYLGLYNYGNINSYGYGDQIWISGLESARENGWTTPEISVNALAEFVKESYMDRGQDIVYLTKYNFNEYGYPAHQYMTNFSGAYSEAQKNADKYRAENLMNEPYTFVIPVYKNMPEKLCPMPDDAVYIDASKINGGIAGRATAENNLENGVTPVVAQVNPIIPDNEGEVVQIPEVGEDKEESNTDKPEEQETSENEQERVLIHDIEMER